MMPKLPLMIKDLKELPGALGEALKEFYRKLDDGTYQLDGYEDDEALKSALTKERSRANGYEKDLKAWKEAGIDDPGKVRDLLGQVEELSRLDPKKEAEKIAEQKINLIRSQLAEQAGKESKELKAKNQSLTAQLSNEKIDSHATKLLAEHKCKSIKVLLPHIKNAVKMAEDAQGNWAVQVVDEAGNPRIGKDAKNMNLVDLVNEMKASPDFAFAFDGSGTKGSGGKGDPVNGGVPQILNSSDPYVLGRNADKIASGEVVVQN